MLLYPTIRTNKSRASLGASRVEGVRELQIFPSVSYRSVVRGVAQNGLLNLRLRMRSELKTWAYGGTENNKVTPIEQHLPLEPLRSRISHPRTALDWASGTHSC